MTWLWHLPESDCSITKNSVFAGIHRTDGKNFRLRIIKYSVILNSKADHAKNDEENFLYGHFANGSDCGKETECWMC